VEAVEENNNAGRIAGDGPDNPQPETTFNIIFKPITWLNFTVPVLLATCAWFVLKPVLLIFKIILLILFSHLGFGFVQKVQWSSKRVEISQSLWDL
jgi:hypothetical protein